MFFRPLQGEEGNFPLTLGQAPVLGSFAPTGLVFSMFITRRKLNKLFFIRLSIYFSKEANNSLNSEKHAFKAFVSKSGNSKQKSLTL